MSVKNNPVLSGRGLNQGYARTGSLPRAAGIWFALLLNDPNQKHDMIKTVGLMRMIRITRSHPLLGGKSRLSRFVQNKSEALPEYHARLALLGWGWRFAPGPPGRSHAP